MAVCLNVGANLFATLRYDAKLGLGVPRGGREQVCSYISNRNPSMYIIIRAKNTSQYTPGNIENLCFSNFPFSNRPRGRDLRE